MKSLIITKWIEPYKLLETIKKEYEYHDFTFTTLNKEVEKKKFLNALDADKNSVGLYMKNVNKFYFFTRKEEFDLLSYLKENFLLEQSDYEITDDVTDKPIQTVDTAKSEASLWLMEV